jgi:hypothetical protein
MSISSSLKRQLDKEAVKNAKLHTMKVLPEFIKQIRRKQVRLIQRANPDLIVRMKF